jgi:Indigoidine synthase A like protein
MVLAHAAGISVFVTGGIGGAHRGAEKSMLSMMGCKHLFDYDSNGQPVCSYGYQCRPDGAR